MTRCLLCHRITSEPSYCKRCIPAANGMRPGWKRTRAAVLSRDGYRCVQCGATANLDVDHITPRSQGGTDSMTNLRTMCASANRGAKQCG